MSRSLKPPSPLLIWAIVLAGSAFMAATTFSTIALASAAVPKAATWAEARIAVARPATATRPRVARRSMVFLPKVFLWRKISGPKKRFARVHGASDVSQPNATLVSRYPGVFLTARPEERQNHWHGAPNARAGQTRRPYGRARHALHRGEQ